MTGRGLRRAPGLAVIEHDDRVVILDLRRIDDPTPHQLEGTALDIWHAIDDVRDRDGVAAAVAAAYGVEVGDIRADIDAFLDSLERLGLIEPG